MAKTIKPEQLSEAIQTELKNYTDDVIKGVKNESKRAMDNLVSRTKATAPVGKKATAPVGKRRKHYRDSITSKQTKNTPLQAIYTWFVKGSDYRLSHLLNNGHALRNGGRYAGTSFITKAYNAIEKDYEEAVERVIQNGG